MEIIPRSEWGFEGPLGSFMSLPSQGVWLHHSVTFPTNDPYADMRYLEEIGKRRFGRLSYSYAIHPDGTIMQGQGDHVGAHTARQNSTSHGVVVIGDYRAETPTPESIAAYGWLLSRMEVAGSTTNSFLKGHRENIHSSTTCPGNELFNKINVINDIKEASMAFTEHEIKELQRIIASLDEVNSNGTFAKYTVDHLRNHPSSGTTDAHARSLAQKALDKIAAIKNAI